MSWLNRIPLIRSLRRRKRRTHSDPHSDPHLHGDPEALHEGRHPALADRFLYFLEHPATILLGFLWGLLVWTWHAIEKAVVYIWRSIVKYRMQLKRAGIVVACLIAVVVAGFCGFAIYVERQVVPVPAPGNIVYLGQGWGNGAMAPDRDAFYHTAQGALVKDIRYEWLANLERPWKTDRFAAPEYMRGYGFIEDSAQSAKNPGQLPVGLAPRYSHKHGEMVVDLTCAGCHTGELNYTVNGVRTSVRIDGGSAHQDLTTMKAGRFAFDLAISLTNTIVNPFKFHRFAAKILKDQDTMGNRYKLWKSLAGTMWDNTKQAIREKPFYPMEEGYGRTDGLGRIANASFAVNLDRNNYRVADAPVSYPVIWEMPWLDWVQYTASVKQPMARNLGEAMGTGARYYLEDPYGQPLPARERFEASAEAANLDTIEHLLRKLKAPCWPENVFGPIDKKKAEAGRKLFWGLDTAGKFTGRIYCEGCHGPHPAPDFVTELDAPYKLTDNNPDPGNATANVQHWMVTALPIQDVGTDPTSADNFVNYRFDLSKTGIQPEELKTEIGPYYKAEYAREIEYYMNVVTLLADKNDGFLSPPPVPLAAPDYILIPQQVIYDTFQSRRAMFAWASCHPGATQMPAIPWTGSKPLALQMPTADQIAHMSYPWPANHDAACKALNGLLAEGEEGYLNEKIGDAQTKSVDEGTGLNYLITLVRNRAYENMGIGGKSRVVERALTDGYAQLDIPLAEARYMARPLAGMWATAPFLHNGSVPSVYELLLPAYERSKKFYVKGANFDPHTLGISADPKEKGAFLFDTSIKGNYNIGHEFRAGYVPHANGAPPQYGVIGPELTDEERWDIIEYLKIHRDYDDPDDICPESTYLVDSPPATGATGAKAATGTTGSVHGAAQQPATVRASQ